MFCFQEVEKKHQTQVPPKNLHKCKKISGFYCINLLPLLQLHNKSKGCKRGMILGL